MFETRNASVWNTSAEQCFSTGIKRRVSGGKLTDLGISIFS